MPSPVLLGARALRRRPLSGSATVLCVALGIAATSASVTMFDAAVFRPVGFADVSRLVVMWESDHARGIELSEVSLLDFEDWSRQSASFASMAAFGSSHWPDLARVGQESVPVSKRAVSRHFFATLGASPLRGRDFGDQDVSGSSPAPVMLSHRFWVAELGGAEDVVGSPLFIGGVEHRVIGVMARGISFPQAPDLWVSVERELRRAFEANRLSPEQQRGVGVLEVLGRLRPEASRAGARDEVTSIARSTYERRGLPSGQRSVVVTPLTDVLLGGLGPRLWIALAMAAAVLLFAGGNAAAIRLASIGERERELAARLFLGATRTRLICDVAAESIALVGLAAGVALPLTAVLLAWLDAIPIVAESGIVSAEHRTATFAAIGVSAALSWLLAGWAPALSAASRSRIHALAATARSVGAGGRSRVALVGAQVALAICLVTMAGGAWQTFDRLSRLDVGFATADVTAIDVSLPEWKYEEPESVRRVQASLLSALEQLPGIDLVAGTSLRPFRFGAIADGLPVKRQEDATTTLEDAVAASRVVVTPRYFRAIGVRILEGREFTDDDRAASQPVAMISRTLARTLWGDVSPVGRRVQSYTLTAKWQTRTVIGVADDVRSRGLDKPALELYVPRAQTDTPLGSFVVRAAADKTPTEATVRQALRGVEPDVALEGMQSTGAIMRTVLAPARVLATTTGLLGAAGLALLALGVFGAAAAALGASRAEVAVRQAVGATPLQAARAPLALLGKGIGAGLAIGVLASPAAMAALVVSGVTQERGWGVPLVAGALIVPAAAALAVWPSMRRAMRASPSDLLRER